jgi:hypothetical protein
MGYPGRPPRNELSSIEQRIVEVETQLAVDELFLTQISVIDPRHQPLQLRIRAHRQTIEVLGARRRALLALEVQASN